ncbi:MAG TPA: tRNA pseudouridine(38-40) synthase TruA, partial [Parasegetibacter sp.]
MPRYFLEVMYHGKAYSGFQVQENAITIQSELERAIGILERAKVELTGSSRTDAGVHARQNFLHFDFDRPVHPHFLYKVNAILPADIVVKSVFRVVDSAHSRFDALSRTYKYYIYRKKNPFLDDRAYFFPYQINLDLMQEAAKVIMEYRDFTSFSKRKTQVKTFNCRILEAGWQEEGDLLVFTVKADRFLRGMVRGIVGTILRVGRGRIDLDEFRRIIEARDCCKADFSTP